MAYRSGRRSEYEDKIDARWWRAERTKDLLENEAGKRITSVVKHLRDRQSLRRKYDLLHARLYGNLRMQGFGVNSYTQVEGIEDDRITLNLVKNMTEAVVSRITQSPPRVKFTTSGESYTLQMRAQLLEQFCEGQRHRVKLDDKAVKAFRNACIYGTGCLKFYACDDEIRVENVPPWMLIVDDCESLEAEPRNLYERRYVDKEVLVELYGDDPQVADKIREASLDPDDDSGYGRDLSADQLLVTEAWHLPPAKGVPGRHVICIDNLTLMDEDWEDPFPYVFIRWTPAPAGFFGIGLAAELIGLQAEVNKLLRQIQHAHHLLGWPRIYLQRGSKIVKTQLTNEIGAIVEYDTTPPQQASFPVVPAEIYGHLKFLIEQAYQIVGISQLAATSQKPAGVESGIALMTLQDVQTVRFAAIEKLWADLFTEASYMMVRLAEKIGKDSKTYSVTALSSDNTMVSIPWKEARMAMDEFVIQTWPTGSVPGTPAGKMEYFQKIAEMGQIDPLELLAGLRNPDLDAIIRQKTAARDVVKKTIEFIIRKRKYVSPEPNDDLDYAVSRGSQEYCRLRLIDDTPEEVLQLLDDYINAAAKLLNWNQQPPPPPAPPMGPGAPEVMPPDATATPPLPPPPPVEGEALPPEPPPMGGELPAPPM